MRRILATFLLAACVPAFAWGPEGHRIVADIARDHLNARAKRAITQLLGNDDLAAISTWADDVRNEHPETAGWHFVDIPWNAEGFNQRRDCYRPSRRDPASFGDHHNCVVDRIGMFLSVLKDTHASRNDRAGALKFLVHFVADVHQPLHAVARERGGNEVKVIEFGSATCGSRLCNLHQVWDLGLIWHAHLSEREYVKRLEGSVAQNEGSQPAAPEQWANESFQIAHEIWVSDGSAIDEAYYHRNIHIVDEQLTRAGLRLAELLNRALGR